ncbi:hypothetical protein ABB37_00479 [Leptomonas pyrrhocoris]|uniref:PHD-type domain-containing protein n=1 Tax=Leptomonas pyrrhocoris TaxID=157538 RepID=A0A0N0E0B3_LEPPY|nr:hypothetical protein ABB37_00479 [Leptomonas pyrrhocoris]KPA86245.1 hypothetical protein ABB37_00479 [Leptomonas pyrrhocoris]|eukprot:XP_015664684.1 hypothetical protein ABB37_00479 [Leptomonas pyrrhocoris]
MSRVHVSLRLRFVKLPNIDSERVFRDTISFSDPDDRSYDDLRALVEAKITFMELPLSEFTVFYTEEETRDRLVVDNALFSSLLRQWSRKVAKERSARQQPPAAVLPMLLGDSASQCVDNLDNLLRSSIGAGAGGGSNSDDEGNDDDARAPDAVACFEIELARTPAAVPDLVRSSAFPARFTTSPLVMPPVQFAALTRENLTRLCEAKVGNNSSSHHNNSNNSNVNYPAEDSSLNAPAPILSPATPVDPNGDVHVRVHALTCPPTYVKFFLRCVILAIRFKTPKPGMTVAELDLGDAEDVTQAITAVTFDEVVHKAIRDHLRGDRRQVLELRQVYVRRKNDVDMRYQTNPHPLLLRLDRSSKLEVVRILATPAPQPGSSGVVTVREQLGSAGVVDVTQLMRLQQQQQQRNNSRLGGAFSSESGVSVTLQGDAFPPAVSSSSSSSGPRRTTFTINGNSGNAGASVALVSGVVPSAYGQELRARQELLLRQAPPVLAAPLEPGVPYVTARDVRQRVPLVEQHANREEQRKQRIRRKTEVSTRCLLCGLDCNDEQACMAIVRQQLTKNIRNRGARTPTFAEVKRDLCDHRRVPPGKEPTRQYCTHTFVNTSTRTVHVVHPRCAHLCSAYQSGNELEDIAECELAMNVCALCGMPGACVACYHPQCTEMYHIVCALYCGGYVNFGQRDPFLPCPACPRHTQVPMTTRKRREEGSNVLHVDHSCWEDGVAFDSRVVESTDLRDPDENDGE